MSGVLRRRWCVPAFLGFAVGMLLLQAAAASARPVPGRAGPALRFGTQLTMANPIRGTGQNISGFSVNSANGFEPITCTPAGSTNCTSNYPSVNPTPVGSAPVAWTAHNGIFGGLLLAHPVPNPNNVTLHLYCIDIQTATRAGINYELGSWEASGMPNVREPQRPRRRARTVHDHDQSHARYRHRHGRDHALLRRVERTGGS